MNQEEYLVAFILCLAVFFTGAVADHFLLPKLKNKKKVAVPDDVRHTNRAGA